MESVPFSVPYSLICSPPSPPPPIPHSPIIDHCGPDSSGIRELLRSKPGRGAQETPPPLSTTLTTQTEREVISLYAPHYSPSFFTSPSPSFSLQETQVTSDCSGGSEKTQRRYKLVNVRVIKENIGRLFHPSPLSLSSSPPPAMEQRLAMGRKDIFRMRKQNTSRPPSMHVDDFMAIGVRHTLTSV